MVRIVFLGTGDAFNTHGRLFTSILVDGSFKILFDCGPTTIYALERKHIPINSISHVIVTHNHGDHISGIPFILLNLKHMNRGKISIICPDSTKRLIPKIYKLFFNDNDFENTYEVLSPDSKLPFALMNTPGTHSVPSLIYRLDLDGKSIVYTGDTGKIDLSRFAKDADILIHEASSLNPKAGEFGHSTPFDAAEAAKQSKVKLLVVTHSPKLSGAVKKKVQRIFKNTIFPRDLQEIDL